jgi:hypothetical protein
MLLMKKYLLAVAAFPLLLQAAEPEPIQRVEINANRDSEWISYRRAYKAAAYFAPFVKARPLIQAHLQLRPLKPGAPLDGLRLHLAGAHVQQDIAVDGIGRALLPMEKLAYEDDAVLTLNRQKGNYYFSGRYSIRERDDGHYPAAELRDACEQLIGAQRASGYRLRLWGKKCAGIKLVYAMDAAPPEVTLRQADGATTTLKAEPAPPFEDGSMGNYQVVIVRFAGLPAQGEVIAATKPLAIGTLYE